MDRLIHKWPNQTLEAKRRAHAGYNRTPQPPLASAWRWAKLPMRRKFAFLAVVLAAAYASGYGVARWRKFIVLHEYHMKDERLIVRRTGPGWDVRDDWRGHMKNRGIPVVFFCFRPLCWFEDCVRGSTRGYPDGQQGRSSELAGASQFGSPQRYLAVAFSAASH